MFAWWRNPNSIKGSFHETKFEVVPFQVYFRTMDFGTPLMNLHAEIQHRARGTRTDRYPFLAAGFDTKVIWCQSVLRPWKLCIVLVLGYSDSQCMNSVCWLVQFFFFFFQTPFSTLSHRFCSRAKALEIRILVPNSLLSLHVAAIFHVAGHGPQGQKWCLLPFILSLGVTSASCAKQSLSGLFGTRCFMFHFFWYFLTASMVINMPRSTVYYVSSHRWCRRLQHLGQTNDWSPLSS